MYENNNSSIAEIQTNLDRLNRLEKIGFLPSAEAWIKMREFRNLITHEYPDNPELMCNSMVVKPKKSCLKQIGGLKNKH